MAPLATPIKNPPPALVAYSLHEVFKLSPLNILKKSLLLLACATLKLITNPTYKLPELTLVKALPQPSEFGFICILLVEVP